MNLDGWMISWSSTVGMRAGGMAQGWAHSRPLKGFAE